MSFGEAEEESGTGADAGPAKAKRKGLTRQDRELYPLQHSVVQNVIVDRADLWAVVEVSNEPEPNPKAGSSRQAETYVDVAPSVKDLANKDKDKVT